MRNTSANPTPRDSGWTLVLGVSSRTIAPLLWIALALCAASCGGARRGGGSVVETLPGVPTPVRFALTSNPPVRIALKADFAQVTVEESLYGPKTLVRFLGGQIVLVDAASGEELGAGDGFRVEPSPGRLIRLEGIAYRGSLDVFVNPFGSPVLVNETSLEEYLRGVVPNELSPRVFPFIEALKAQSVAARTFAAGQLGRRARFGFDLFADERSQVYGGLSTEQPESNQAVEQTAGLIATYDKRPITAFYSSTCGGTTANYTDMFPARRSLGEGGPNRRSPGEGGPIRRSPGEGGPNRRSPGEGGPNPTFPYLKGGISCPDGASPYSHWTNHVTPPTIRPLLDRFADVGRLKSLKIEKRDPAGRVVEMLFEGEDGTKLLKGNDLRFALGLRSNFITKLTPHLDHQGYMSTLDVEGRGFGHGVGMCQFGAVEWARQGKSFDWILRRYYPGVALSRAY